MPKCCTPMMMHQFLRQQHPDCHNAHISFNDVKGPGVDFCWDDKCSSCASQSSTNQGSRWCCEMVCCEAASAVGKVACKCTWLLFGTNLIVAPINVIGLVSTTNCSPAATDCPRTPHLVPPTWPSQSTAEGCSAASTASERMQAPRICRPLPRERLRSGGTARSVDETEVRCCAHDWTCALELRSI